MAVHRVLHVAAGRHESRRMTIDTYNMLRLNRLILRAEEALTVAQHLWSVYPSTENEERLEVALDRVEKLAEMKRRSS